MSSKGTLPGNDRAHGRGKGTRRLGMDVGTRETAAVGGPATLQERPGGDGPPWPLIAARDIVRSHA